jgi:hypothetical protein
VLNRKIVCCDLPTPRKIIRDKRSSHPHPDVSMCGVRTPGYIHDTGHHPATIRVEWMQCCGATEDL